MSAPAVAVRDLCKRYDAALALDHVSFEVPRGAAVALLGGNGAGKTTTLSILLGLLLPTSGEVRVLGVDMLKQRYSALPRMNFTSPYVDLPHRLSVGQNLDVYARLYGIRRRRERIGELAETFGITQLLKRSYGSLSAGQRTRVSLAKAILNEPELLLMDEPTASLDPASADRIRSYLDDYRRRTGATLLLASHNMQEVERLCQTVLMLKQGRIVDQGPPAELTARYGRENLEQVFIAIARGEAV
ncbi:ABC transporter ATP-binding protein [Methyloterricola oryzae]|uniref:ABC transporter ATP-binding protein n=1 Tax=Methyloterricola oryzae TaxID=1495050 RepID=UPI0005EAD3D9|nr:ABC transporter ATP-binding protein [Methyloterricola oryzae]